MVYKHSRFRTAEDYVKWRNQYAGYDVEAVVKDLEGYEVFWWG